MTFIQICALAAWMGLSGLAGAAEQPVKQGEATYFLAPKWGDLGPPAAPLRTAAMLRSAAQTNQWYSALIFNPQPEVIFVQPITIRATSAGLELALPGKEVIATERGDTEISYPHRDPLLISPTDFAPGPAKLAKASD